MRKLIAVFFAMLFDFLPFFASSGVANSI